MKRDARVALVAAALFVSCSVYEPALLTGEGDDGGGAVSPRGGSSGKGGGSGTGGSSKGGSGGSAPSGGTPAAGAGGPSAGAGGKAGTSGRGGSSGKGGSSGRGGEAGSGGDAGAPGDGGEANGGEANAGSSGDSGASAGTSGASGSGTSGTGGGGNAGSAGTAGTGGGGGTTGNEVCSGCARLSVALTAATDKAHFVITLPTSTDFTDAVITLRVFRRAGSGGGLRAYLQHNSPEFEVYELALRPLMSLNGWVDVVYDLAPVTGYDKTIVRRLGIELIGTGSTSWTNPTVVYIDSISITNTTLNPSVFAFDTTDSVKPTASVTSPDDQRIWLNRGTNDTNASASLSWLGP